MVCSCRKLRPQRWPALRFVSWPMAGSRAASARQRASPSSRNSQPTAWSMARWLCSNASRAVEGWPPADLQDPKQLFRNALGTNGALEKESAGYPSARDSRRVFLDYFAPVFAFACTSYPCRLFPQSSGAKGPPIPGTWVRAVLAARAKNSCGLYLRPAENQITSTPRCGSEKKRRSRAASCRRACDQPRPKVLRWFRHPAGIQPLRR